MESIITKQKVKTIKSLIDFRDNNFEENYISISMSFVETNTGDFQITVDDYITYIEDTPEGKILKKKLLTSFKEIIKRSYAEELGFLTKTLAEVPEHMTNILLVKIPEEGKYQKIDGSQVEWQKESEFLDLID